MSLLSFPCGCCSSRKFYPGCTRAGRLKPVYVHFLVLHNHNRKLSWTPSPIPIPPEKHRFVWAHGKQLFPEIEGLLLLQRVSTDHTFISALFSVSCFLLPAPRVVLSSHNPNKSFSSRVSTVSKRNHDLCLSSPKQDLWGIDFSIESSGSAVS